MTTHKNRLPPSALMGYIRPAPHKTGAGIETPLANKAHNRASGFFTCTASSHLRIMVGRTGPLSGGPVSLFAGSLNPVRLTTPSLRPLGGELSQLTKQGYPSWQTVNNASAAIRSHASTPKPKSTADCTAPTIWRCSCRPICVVCHTARCRYGCRQFWTTSPTISATFSDCLTSHRTPRNAPPVRPCSSGAFVHPVNREVWP
ncbi:TPA: ash family protein [Salmonella enterica]|uniref:Ash family protein n=1 Tax=Salmonella enterica TaxID=28901 RepID=A0A756IGM3_SALER|nr:ash family protein [Salmonella enterica]